jgi:transcriptional regulator with PAS, ATPase and Fis domain
MARSPALTVHVERPGNTGATAHQLDVRTLTAFLVLLGGAARLEPRPRLVRLAEGLEIGRGEAELTPELWQIDDPVVSRRHARIEKIGASWQICDLGSRNGTRVERHLLRDGTLPLQPGALIAVGDQFAVFRLASEEQLRWLEEEGKAPLGPVPTASPALVTTLRRLRILARTERHILLCGETGTGKEVYARAAHEVSGRTGPFLALNCAGLSKDLFESELFGYRRGSHSQAYEDRPGLVASAHGGTLFLDEIGEMPPALQAKLLRFLQDKTILGLGWTRPRAADVRIIAATQNPFESLRQDIIGRLGAEPLLLPPLRQRREDLGALCVRFLSAVTPPRPGAFERDAFDALCAHGWRRNVRELEATVTEAALLAADRRSSTISLGDLPLEIRNAAGHHEKAEPSRAPAVTGAGDGTQPAAALAKPPRRPRPTREELERLLRENRGDVPVVARQLGRHRELVWRWCKALAIDPHEFE